MARRIAAGSSSLERSRPLTTDNVSEAETASASWSAVCDGIYFKGFRYISETAITIAVLQEAKR